jgi:uncharacterized membrane protein (UPF0182 family)
MFTVVYLFAIILAAAPLGRTLLRASAEGRVSARRIYRDLLPVGAVVLGIITLEVVFRISLQNYWFGELGQQYRYWLALGLRTGIFATAFVVVGLFVGGNLRALSRMLRAVPRSMPWLAGFGFAAIVAWGATSLWVPLLAFLGAAPSGDADPVFGKDLSFYLLALPLYDHLVGLLDLVLIVTIAAWALTGLYLYQHSIRPGAGGFLEIDTGQPRDERVVWVAKADRLRFDDWLRHGAILGSLFCLVSAAGRVLGRYHLAITGHSAVVAGASYVDVHYWLPAYDVIIVAWLTAAGLFAAAAALTQFRRWLLAAPSHWGLTGGLLLVVYVAAALIPSIVERVYVEPNQITLEQPYLLRSIAGTRRAYNLDGPTVEEQEFTVSAKPLSAADLDANAATLQDARIWDWRALEPQLQQTQGLRPYYTFSGVDIDRYTIDGAERQVMVTARELDVDKLPDAAKVWVNLALKYTHGYGIVAVPVNEMDGHGNPVPWAHDIPVEAKGDLAVAHGEIYYGQLTNDRVYVDTTEKEFDFPKADANAETIYSGSGGIALSSLWRKLVVAHEFDGLRLFISGYFTEGSRVLLRRNVVERVRRLAPFLTFDRDPYIVAQGDHYSFIVDAYTSSANYPYSEAYDGTYTGFREQNYLRNSVKAVVDAYNGSVTFYVFDDKDPIISAYRRMLPDLFRDAGAMPDSLRRHIRYPEDLFAVQAEMYGTFHMTNPTTFYNREDRWQVPRELYRDREIEMAPYYVLAQLPGAPKPEFLLMLPLAVYGKNQMAGWLAGLCDGANYGKMVAFRFPKGRFVDGPAQIESRINSDARFSGDLTLWDQHGSMVIRGTLVVLPLNGNQLIAIEPVYIEAEQTKIPTLTRVVLAQLLPDDRKIEWAPSLREVERLMVGLPAPQPAASAEIAGTGRLVQAKAVFEEMQKAYAAGNFAKYGELLQELGRILTQP